MLMKMRSKMQNQKGFTLVELMVVVVILGILVAIAVPVYNSVTDKAKISAIEANLRTIDGAIMMYGSNNDGTFTGLTEGELTGNYLQVWPDSPGTYAIDTTDADNPMAKVTISSGEAFGKITADTYTLSKFIAKANS